MEGTFPRSRQVIDEVFGGTALAPEIRADILGGTAARLYGVRPRRLAEKLAAHAEATSD
jgi:hypothetical protein